MQDIEYRGFTISCVTENLYVVSRLIRNGGRNQMEYLYECGTLKEAKKFIREYFKY